MSETPGLGDTLVAFYVARLDEDEAAAKAATPGVWYATGGDILTRGDSPHWAGACAANATGADAEHIARHDPPRALRRVEAGRRLIGRFRAALAARQDEYDPTLAALYGQIRDEAAVYSDHPDYRPDAI